MLLACSKKIVLCWVTAMTGLMGFLHHSCGTAVGFVPWNSGSFTEGAAPCCARSTCLGKQAFRVYFPVTLQVLLTPPTAGASRGSPGLCWRHPGEPLHRRQLFPATSIPGNVFSSHAREDHLQEEAAVPQCPGLCTMVKQAREQEQLLLGEPRGNTSRGQIFCLPVPRPLGFNPNPWFITALLRLEKTPMTPPCPLSPITNGQTDLCVECFWIYPNVSYWEEPFHSPWKSRGLLLLVQNYVQMWMVRNTGFCTTTHDSALQITGF